MSKKVFITGMGGCVGHYLFDVLANDKNYELWLLIRNPAKVKFDYKAYPNIHLIHDDFKNIKKHADLIRKMDIVIHMMADWGGNFGSCADDVAFFELLDPKQCKKVIYFSTASILDQNNQPDPDANKYGTFYIQGKYRFYKTLPKLPIYPNVITLFPTWVLGGDKSHPFSHASTGILEMRKWLNIIRFFTANASFHFIHASDIAQITKHILDHTPPEKNYVLGNAPLTINGFIRKACHFFAKPVYRQVTISPLFVKTAAGLLGKKMHSWDIYCLERRHFQHRTVNAEYFGLSSRLSTVEQILAELV